MINRKETSKSKGGLELHWIGRSSEEVVWVGSRLVWGRIGKLIELENEDAAKRGLEIEEIQERVLDLVVAPMAKQVGARNSPCRDQSRSEKMGRSRGRWSVMGAFPITRWSSQGDMYRKRQG